MSSRDRGVRSAIPPAERRQPDALRRCRCVLRRHRPRSENLHREGRDRRRWREFRRPGRHLHVPAEVPGAHRRAERGPVPNHVALSGRTDRGQPPHRGPHHDRGQSTVGRGTPRGGDARAHSDVHVEDGRAGGCSASSAPNRPRPGSPMPSPSTPTVSSSPTATSPMRTPIRCFTGRDPLPFETSMMGVFAVGDVRHGSLKRVAAAVGEGSSAVRSVHEHLSTGIGVDAPEACRPEDGRPRGTLSPWRRRHGRAAAILERRRMVRPRRSRGGRRPSRGPARRGQALSERRGDGLLRAATTSSGGGLGMRRGPSSRSGAGRSTAWWWAT